MVILLSIALAPAPKIAGLVLSGRGIGDPGTAARLGGCTDAEGGLGEHLLGLDRFNVAGLRSEGGCGLDPRFHGHRLLVALRRGDVSAVTQKLVAQGLLYTRDPLQPLVVQPLGMGEPTVAVKLRESPATLSQPTPAGRSGRAAPRLMVCADKVTSWWALS
ncbi:hypothetical protein CRD60_06995 [Bifidobacterium aemilianum]|uniref:Uncharacterized protein n=1 Tax=Bifidobacterium aemilianum TaxID=2493120 RepID=A0A366K6J6_9BIFI|nr:hypothetical protein CRD60_06995 [Bifidobacterium aemilianum]